MPNETKSGYTPRIHTLLATPVSLDLGPASDSPDAQYSRIKVVAEQFAQIADLKSQIDRLNRQPRTPGLGLGGLPSGVEAAPEAALAMLQPVESVAGTGAPVAESAKTGATLSAPAKQISDDLDKLDAEVASLKLHLAQYIQEAQSKTAVDVGGHVGRTAPELPIPPERALPLLRKLVQAQALAIDQEPNRSYAGVQRAYMGKRQNWTREDVALVGLIYEHEAEAAELLGGEDSALYKRYLLAFEPFEKADAATRARRFVEMQRLAVDIAAHLAPT